MGRRVLVRIKMDRDNSKLPLSVRISKYYEENKLEDGKGGRLQSRLVAEFSPFVTCVQDSLEEFDIFFDITKMKVVEAVDSPYRLFLKEVMKNAQGNAENLAERYGMTVIAESAWNPCYGRRASCFFSAFDAAKHYLEPLKKDEEPQWNCSPKLLP